MVVDRRCLRCSDGGEDGSAGRGCKGCRWCAAIRGPRNPPACEGGIDGFTTLNALGLDWQRIEALTLCARTPSGGVHAWFKPVSGKSRTLGQGVEWFSKGKYVVSRQHRGVSG
jgi:hypothetical protein